jgi:voltage-gated potassium channel
MPKILSSPDHRMQKRPVLTVITDTIAGTVSGRPNLGTYAAVAIGLAAMMTLSSDADASVKWIGSLLWLSITLFVWELIARLISAAMAARVLAYILSGVGIIDVLSALAIPVALACGMALRPASLLGVFWLLKPVSRIPGLRQLRRVVTREAEPLSSVLVLFLIVLFMAASIAYLAERDINPGFSSLPASLWWAVVTLTTTGYGDVVPMTLLGRIVAALLMICGLAVFGLWTGILATGFAAENRRHNFIQTWESLGKVPFFAALGPATLADVTNMLRRIDMRRGTTIIRRGQVGDCMYFIAAGEVEVELPGKNIQLGVGAFFGELALLENSVRTATVVTTRSTTLLVLDLIDFRALMARHPELANAIDVEAARRAAENASRTTR